MRTKTLLLTAALVAAGVATSTAQIVYSANAVGYVTKHLKPGLNLLANPLNNSSNSIQQVIPLGPGFGSFTLIWDFALQDFDPTRQSFFFPGLIDATHPWFEYTQNFASTETLVPGQGFFISNEGGADADVTFVGEVPQGTQTLNIKGPGNNFIGSMIPQAGGISDLGINSTIALDGMIYQTFDATLGDYDPNAISFYFGTTTFPANPELRGWYDSGQNFILPAGPPIDVAQGALFYSPGNVAWTRNFSVSP